MKFAPKSIDIFVYSNEKPQPGASYKDELGNTWFVVSEPKQNIVIGDDESWSFTIRSVLLQQYPTMSMGELRRIYTVKEIRDNRQQLLDLGFDCTGISKEFELIVKLDPDSVKTYPLELNGMKVRVI